MSPDADDEGGRHRVGQSASGLPLSVMKLVCRVKRKHREGKREHTRNEQYVEEEQRQACVCVCVCLSICLCACVSACMCVCLYRKRTPKSPFLKWGPNFSKLGSLKLLVDQPWQTLMTDEWGRVAWLSSLGRYGLVSTHRKDE